MQQFTTITDSNKINDWPELTMANLNTILSNSSGETFPSVGILNGMNCYREDEGKLYALLDKTNNTWKLVADLNKTYQSKEDADEIYLLKTSLTSSLTDGSSSKAATAAAVKSLSENLSSHIESYNTLTGPLVLGEGNLKSSADLEINKSTPILKLKSATSGSNTVEKAAALVMGPTDNASLSIAIKGDGTGFIGLGALDANNQPTNPVIRINPGQNGLSLYGALSGTSGSFNSSLHCEGVLSTGSDITAEGSITAQGDVSAFSDQSIKQDVKTIPDALRKVLDMRGVYFTRKSDKEKSLGVIAQEIEAVEPRLVKEADGLKSVTYGNMVGLLIEAVKDLNEKVEKNAAV